MQATTPKPSGADVAPQTKAPGITVYTSGDRAEVLKIPTNRDEMRALLARRREISSQLNSVTERRNNLIQQLQTMPAEASQGVRSQLAVLDARVLQLETDLGTVGKEVAGSSPQLIAMAQESFTPPAEDSFGAGVAVGSVTIFLVMSAFVFFSRRRWRISGSSAPMLPAADSERLQRLENGMEAMAIEVERISEGQRFVTKLLTESRAVEPAPR